MGTLYLPNTISNGQSLDASKVQQNFDAIKTHANSEVVHKDGSVAMTARLTLAALDPTTNDHAVRKAYVDSFFPLTRANLNTGLMPRIRVADAAARTALTSLVAGQEVVQGDNDVVYVYNGTNWSIVQARSIGGSGNDFNITSGVNVGTGGVKNMGWHYVGGPTGGLLTVAVEIQLGTSGFSVASQPVIDFPAVSGFTFSASSVFDNAIELGPARLVDASPSSVSRGWAKRNSATAFTLTTDLGAATMGASAPFTWAANDKMVAHFTVRGTMNGS